MIRLLGAGQTLGKVVEAARLLRDDWNITSEVWSCPSYTRLMREGHEAERWNMLHPLSKEKDLAYSDLPWVEAVARTGRHRIRAAYCRPDRQLRFRPLCRIRGRLASGNEWISQRAMDCGRRA